jgi:hypothetical protein
MQIRLCMQADTVRIGDCISFFNRYITVPLNFEANLWG